MSSQLTIHLAEGSQEIGLAVMLQDLLRQNLEDHVHKQMDFNKLNIGIGLLVFDAEISLTMEFSNGRLTIHPGIKDSPGLIINADAESVMNLSNQRIKWGLPYYFDETGREVVGAIKSGRLKIKGMIKHFPSLIRLSRIMSVH